MGTQYEIYLENEGNTVCQFILVVDSQGQIEIEPVGGFSKARIEEKFC